MNVIYRIAVLSVAAGLALAKPDPVLSASRAADGQAKPDTSGDAAGATKTQAMPPIRSRLALDAYLRAAADKGQATPFDHLSPGARLRFMASLSFGKRGLGGFDPSELGATLTADEIRSVLALFGPEIEEWADHIDSTKPDDSEAMVSAPISDIESRFNQLYMLDRRAGNLPDHEHGARLASRYRELFPSSLHDEELKNTRNSDLRLLYRAAALADAYAPDPIAADAMARALNEMDGRGIATKEQVEDTYNHLLAARRFRPAREFASAHPAEELPSLPVFSDAIEYSDARPSVWDLGATGGGMTRTPVDLEPLQILVMAGCHFADDAARDIAADPVLGPVFKAHARWLMLPPGMENIDDVREWNRKHPDARATMIYDRSQWNMLGRWLMPTYVIVKDGKVLAQASGWPPNPDRQHLIDILKEAGFALGDAADPPSRTAMPESRSTTAK